jgi:hypothetical protein
MKNSKLIEILASFSNDEIFEFRKFMGDLFRNKDSASFKLFQLLEKSYPKFNERHSKKNTF